MALKLLCPAAPAAPPAPPAGSSGSVSLRGSEERNLTVSVTSQTESAPGAGGGGVEGSSVHLKVEEIDAAGRRSHTGQRERTAARHRQEDQSAERSESSHRNLVCSSSTSYSSPSLLTVTLVQVMYLPPGVMTSHEKLPLCFSSSDRSTKLLPAAFCTSSSVT